MSLTAVITIGNFDKDSENLGSICERIGTLALEVIFVMDKQSNESETNLIQSCKEFGLRNFSILKHDKRNPGTGRNLGLSNSHSDWITFWDSDDLPCPKEILEILDEVEDIPDVVIGEYVSRSNLKRRHKFDSNFSDNLDQIIFNPGIWRFLIRRSVAQKYKFPEIRMGEDQVYIIQLLTGSPRISFVRKPIYEYSEKSTDSLTSEKKNIDDLVVAINLGSKHLSNRDFYFRTIIFMIYRQIQSGLKYGNMRVRSQVLLKVLKIFIGGPKIRTKLFYNFLDVQRNFKKNVV